MFIRRSCLPALTIHNEGVCQWRQNTRRFFGFCLSSTRMEIECAFGRLKVRFGCLQRDRNINIDDLPDVIHLYFVLNKFCEINKEVINQSYVEATKKSDLEFQSAIFTGHVFNDNELHGKKMRNVYVKYFNQ